MKGFLHIFIDYFPFSAYDEIVNETILHKKSDLSITAFFMLGKIRPMDLHLT